VGEPEEAEEELMSNPIQVKVKRLHPDARLPTMATPGSACFDLYAGPDDKWILYEDKRTIVGTGIAVEIPRGYEGQVRSRSGLATKGIVVANSPGTIDCDYRGEVKVIIWNLGGWYPNRWIVHPGDRIAQLAIRPVPMAEMVEAEELSSTERGNGGFGSTGR
jgi:dUTP pyrophosphatase